MIVQARTNLFSFFLVLLAAAGSASDCHAAPQNQRPLPVSIEHNIDLVIDELTQRGFEVTQGYFRLYTLDDCKVSFEVMQSCYGNNPAAPYVTFAVLPWEGEEFLDPATRNAIGLLEEGYTGTFRFDPKEAIVVFGRMPPPAAYFGLQTYLFTREGTFHTDSDTYKWIAANLYNTLDAFFTYVPNNPDRIQMLASIGNSNNDVIVKEQAGSAFNQERFFISTPDRAMDEAVRSALAAVSIDPRHVFTEPIPSTREDGDSGMKIGLGASADEFLFVMRYAMPKDGGGPGSPSLKWQNELPLTVLRVRDTSGRAAQPYDPPVILDKRTAVDESLLAADLTRLVVAVNERWAQPCATGDCSDRAADFIDLQGSQVNLVGPECTKIGMNCIGDTQDTTYQMTADLLLDTGFVYAAAGTLGTRTGNATYVGLSVNDSHLIKGVANIDVDRLRNTASAYAADLTNPSKFYLVYLARDCGAIDDLTDGNCFEVTTDMLPVCTDLADPDCHPLKLIQREYISKGTARGPDSTLLLPPKLIRLQLP